jgi:hypothetical protein
MNNKSQARRGCAKSENGNVVRLVVNSGSEGHRRRVGAAVLRRPAIDEVLLGKTREGREEKTLLLEEEQFLLLLGYSHMNAAGSKSVPKRWGVGDSLVTASVRTSSLLVNHMDAS